MKPDLPVHSAPTDAMARKAMVPVVCYPTENLPRPDLAPYLVARLGWRRIADLTVPPRDARCFTVPAGCFFRITCTDGPQVGDLNLWSASDLAERFFAEPV